MQQELRVVCCKKSKFADCKFKYFNGILLNRITRNFARPVSYCFFYLLITLSTTNWSILLWYRKGCVVDFNNNFIIWQLATVIYRLSRGDTGLLEIKFNLFTSSFSFLVFLTTCSISGRGTYRICLIGVPRTRQRYVKCSWGRCKGSRS